MILLHIRLPLSEITSLFGLSMYLVVFEKDVENFMDGEKE